MLASDGFPGDGFRTIARGVALFAGLGCVIGGAIGTAAWPVVGTFFGAAGGAVTGAGTGLLSAGALLAVTHWTTSKWAARVTSGLVAGTAQAAFVTVSGGPERFPIMAAALVVAVTAGGALGPLIAYGMKPAVGGPLAARRLQHLGSLILGCGSAAGAAIGAVAGLIAGLVAYPPTALFAAVEGGLLGLVSGIVLACLAVGVAVLPRLRARR